MSLFNKLLRGFLSALLALGLLGCAEKAQFVGIDLTGADYAKDFTLTDHNGQQRSMADFKGKTVLVFFGFTQCPDFCPTALTSYQAVKAQLGPDGERMQVLFVTVDPERDTAELLKAYLANFDPQFLGLVPSLQALPELAKNFKIHYKKVDGPTPTSYTMDHSAGTYVYDPAGRLRLYHRHGMEPQAVAADLKLLLAGR